MQRIDELSREELIAVVLEQRGTLQRQERRIGELEGIVAQLREQNASLAAELEKLRKGGGKQVPSFVKPSKKKEQGGKARKKRAMGYSRKRMEPTRVEQHALQSCPRCGHDLGGGYIKRVREVIEIPRVEVEVVHHEILERRCPRCGKRCVPRVSSEELGVVGKHRLGVNLMSFVAGLREAGRMTIGPIVDLLRGWYGIGVSRGEIVEILHDVAEAGKRSLGEVVEGIRRSGVVNADETGWREDGRNGYVWVFMADGMVYLLYSSSRSGKVALEVLGEGYEGVVVSDFYKGYNRLEGIHQRCWVHLLRLMDELVEKSEGEEGVVNWVEEIKRIYREAKLYEPEGVAEWAKPAERGRAALEFREKLMGLVRPYIGKECAQRNVAELIGSHEPELFVFVEDPKVPSDNNAAERSLRPTVIARKISGGTRSSKGTETRMSLRSLLATWSRQRKDVFEEMAKLLRQPPVPATARSP